MEENINRETQTNNATGAENSGKLFTQEQVNQIVADRLARERSKADTEGSFKEKYEAEHKAFEEFKQSIETEKLTAAKEKVLTEILAKAGISEKRLHSVAKLAKVDGFIDKLELDEKGAVKNACALEKELKAEYSEYIVKTEIKGAETAKPPYNSGSGFDKIKNAFLPKI